MKTLLLFICLTYCLCCCESQKSIVCDNVVTMLCKDAEESTWRIDIPLEKKQRYTNIPIFVLSDNSLIIKTNTECLHEIYVSHFYKNFSTFKEFLSKSLNHKVIIHKENIQCFRTSIFSLNDVIRKEYENLGFEDFYNDYIVKDENSIKLNYTKYDTRDELLSIIYFFYLNQKIVMLNDYEGLYYVKDWDNCNP